MEDIDKDTILEHLDNAIDSLEAIKSILNKGNKTQKEAALKILKNVLGFSDIE